MADISISSLPDATSVNASDVFPIVQSGTTKKAAASLISAAVFSTNVFRIDPSPGAAPFQTVQTAIDAIAVLAAGNDPPDAVVIDIGVNRFTESLTLDNSTGTWPIIIFKGVTDSGNYDISANQSHAFSLLEITGAGNQLDIRIKDCACGQIVTDSPLVLVFDNGNANGNSIVSTYSGANGLTLGSMYGGGNGFPGAITANDTDILLFGITSDAPGGSIVTTANRKVTVAQCGQPPEGTTFGGYTQSLFSINAPNGIINANDSYLKDIICISYHFVRSKAYGTITVNDSGNPSTNDQGPYAYNYDFARDGGAQGTIFLFPSSGSNGGSLPDNFVVTGAILDIITPPDSAGHTATVALTSGESAGDLKTAAVVSGVPWSTMGLKSLVALLGTSGSRDPAMVIAVQDLTVGKFTLNIEGYLSSSFIPKNPIAQWEANSLGFSDNDDVTAWADKVSSQTLIPNSATIPKFKTSIINSLPVVRFAGADGAYLKLAGFNNTDPSTFIIVAKQSSKATQASFIGDGQRISLTVTFGRFAASGGTPFVFSNTDRSGAFHVFTVIFNAGVGTGYVDGALIDSGSVGSDLITDLLVGGSTEAGSTVTGDIAEVWIYSGALSNSQREYREVALATKYGL